MSSATLVFPFPKNTPNVAPYGSWTLDQGVDIWAPAHTPELAVEAGTVTYQAESGFGPNVAVLHGASGTTYYYGHAGPGGQVPPGSHVTAGQQIAEVGAGKVGLSTGPHLEIGIADPSTGAPANTGSSQLRDALRTGVLRDAVNTFKSQTSGSGIPGVPDIPNPVTGALRVGEQVAKIYNAATWITNGQNALKVLLYATLIFGGVSLAGYGLGQALKPAMPRRRAA